MGTDVAGIDAPLLTSKLLIPPVPPEVIERSRLHRLLDGAAGRILTTLTAPAGWGKTVLLSTWALARAQTRRIGWLSAEPGESGDQFRRYLHAALRRAVPRLAAGRALLTPADLANAIAWQPEPITMIIDELDRVADPSVWEDLDYLLRNATGRLHLMVATRTRPPTGLHRWGLRGELTEIGAAELAFAPEETAEVVHRHGLSLPLANLCDLQQRTEGWPAGVWLAAARLKELPADARRLGRPTGDDPQIGEYLLAEVLGGQPDDVRETMVDVSVLDRISTTLLEALTGRADGERLLAELARGTFVAPLDGSWLWYRLNPLFGEALRAELRRRHPSRVPHLHSRAARWFAEHDLAADALRHALASGDRALITSVLDEHWYQLLSPGHRSPTAIETVRPPGAAVREDPRVALACAASRLELHDHEGAEAYLRLAGRGGADGPGGDRFTLTTTAFRLAQARLRGDVPAMAATAGAILEAVHRHVDAPQEYDDAAAAIANTTLGTTHLLNGDVSQAEAALREGCRYAIAAQLPCDCTVGQSRLAFALALRGELGAAHRSAREALESPPCPGQTDPAHCAPAYLALATVALHRGQPGEAAANADLAAGLWDYTNEPAFNATVRLVQAQILLELGEWTRCRGALLAARRSMPEHGLTEHLRDLVMAAEADLLTAHGDPIAARDLLVPLLADGAAGPAVRVAYARACLRNRDPRTAAGVVASWASPDGAGDPLPLRLAAGLIHAEAARQLGDGRQASASLEHVLALAEPEDFRQVFTGVSAPGRELLLEHLDAGTAHRSFLSGLLEAQGRNGPQAGAPPALPDPLTGRELTILRYLQSLLSNVEIAAELNVSVNTIKTHVRNIYRKLNANQRRDAVRRARALQLL